MKTDLVKAHSGNEFEFNLLNNFQRDFPLVARPFAVLAEQLGSDEASVLTALCDLQRRGVVSRVGAVFRANAVGASALAALAVPAERLAAVAQIINARVEVNHNYEREHRYNCWFVAAAASVDALYAALREIESACDCGALLILPMLEDFHIDLGFDLHGQPPDPQTRPAAAQAQSIHTVASLNQDECTLLAALQQGLPLVARPFAGLGLPEAQVLATLARWQDEGLIKRFGVIVRHHELGFSANVMLVWDVPDSAVSALGRRIAASGRVTLCYRRARQLPHWRYNLFCMIHGKDRAEVGRRIAALVETCGLHEYAHEVLFSQRRFKQRGAHYVVAATPVVELHYG